MPEAAIASRTDCTLQNYGGFGWSENDLCH